MSDDLAAKAANWVPPWQRPAGSEAEAEAEADADAEASAGAASGGEDEHETDAESDTSAGAALPGQWDKLAGTKWQSVRPGDPESGPAELDPQLSDCMDEDETEAGDEAGDEGDPGGGSWNARDAVAARGLAEDAQDAKLAGGVEEAEAAGGAADAEAAGPSGELREAGPDDEPGPGPALSGDGQSGDELSGDVRSGDVRSGDVLSGDELSGDELSGDARSDVEDSAGELSGDAPEWGQGQLFVPVQRVAEERTEISDTELVAALEAILMVVDVPVSEMVLAQVLEVPAERVANALIDLSARYTHEGKGFDLRRAAGGWRFYTRAEYSAYVERFVLDGQQLRLTQASLETLAVVAYKQPVTRSRISAIRGVNCDGVVRTLVTRGLIEECGTEPESGAHLYRTTNLFLEKLGLDTVEQLPPLAPFLPDNLDEVAANE